MELDLDLVRYVRALVEGKLVQGSPLSGASRLVLSYCTESSSLLGIQETGSFGTTGTPHHPAFWYIMVMAPRF